MLTRPRRLLAGALVTGLLGVGGLVSAGPAAADTDGGRYLALGDSIAFGYSPLLEDPWRPERFVGYPELVDRRTELSTTNLACPGQTAQALVSMTAPDAGCFEMRQFARDAGFVLLHTDYRGTQLDAAVRLVRSGAAVGLVSIQGGGNELSMCLSDRRPQQCFEAALPKVSPSLRAVAVKLRDAGYRGPIVMVGYHLVPGLESPVRQINRAIAQAASQTHSAYADAAVLFDRYARQHHGDLCTTGLLVLLPDGSCDLHPTRTGQALYADAVLDAVADDVR